MLPSRVHNMVVAAGKIGAARLRSAGTVIQSRANVMINKAIKGTIEGARLADKSITGAKNFFQIPQGGPVLAGIGPVGKTREVFENTHAVENKMRDVLSRFDGVNLSGNNKSVEDLEPVDSLEKTGDVISGSKFSAEKLKDLKGFDFQLDSILENYQLTRSEFNELKLKPHDELSQSEVETLKAIRESVMPITKETIVQKTIPASDLEKYLNGTYSEIGGYVAKAEDVHDIKDYADFVESLRLDYLDWDGNRPFPDGGSAYGIIKFKTDMVDSDFLSIPYGEKLGGKNTDGPPCTLNGFTASRNDRVVPEFKFNGRYFPQDGAELYRVNEGKETLVAVFNEDYGKFKAVKNNE